jgi:hypothetical protein
MNQPSSCVFCRRDLPHERHVSPLEYAKLTANMETYSADINRVHPQSGVDVVAAYSAGRKIA